MESCLRHPKTWTCSPSTINTPLENEYRLKYERIDIQRLCKQARLKEALNMLDFMDQHGIKANSKVYISLLQCCLNMKALTEGKRIHEHIVKSGVQLNMFLGNTLINMYIKCGSVKDARNVFDNMPERNVYTWSIMIAGCVHIGKNKDALDLFWEMQRDGVKPNEVTCASILKACANTAALEQGKKIHAFIIRNRIEMDVFVGSILVDMYAKCGSINQARLVFDKMASRDTVLWTAMIAAYAQHGQSDKAFELFHQMEQEGVKPNKVTFLNILKTCASVAALEKGKQIHAQIIKRGFGLDIVMGNALIDMYAKCGRIEDARGIFNQMHKRDVVSWNAMIGGYVQHEDSREALKLFQKMKSGGVYPDEVTFVNIIKACTGEGALEQLKQIHACITKSSFESDIFVGSSLVDMYAKCGCIDHARRVFDEMPKRGVVTWTAMIAGYAQHGQGKQALELFHQMQEKGLMPNEITFVSALKACASVAALEQGKQIHTSIIKKGLDSDTFVGSALIDMYAKCGSIRDARSVFEKVHERGMVSWTAIIAGYAQHGYGKEALQLVKQMQLEGVKLDSITFLSILSACSHAGFVHEGCSYFHSMSKDYGIIPSEKHYACMVDLLGRAGCLLEAENFIKEMPLPPSAAIWTALLGACRIHGNMEIAKHAAERILELKPQNAAALFLLSNIYAASGCTDDKTRIRHIIDASTFKQKPGCSHIEIRNQVHTFIEGDKRHPQIKEIHAELERLSAQMEQAGYVPETRILLHEQKETSWYHSENLAIAFGIISTPNRMPIRVVKNLRICDDCHTVAKFIAKVAGREIIVRDTTHVHCFRDGVCSCGDYW